ncbi:bifunctional diguanylate cyclase/phosphodiesterase [Novosphingobium sp. TH158]|uniref:putative bifunctional diguanylate cyclase/phosphodiesterase n=1 Tax=Novosphingobium sp. TH158 TaxID=2067455 RepID=UPI000C7993D5|nr:EAL domain-containing protein [Novosphingobium sp. TH158]PLK24239.1 GGDEF domain-containing protein [Novosphingobium sp. TH158]
MIKRFGAFRRNASANEAQHVLSVDEEREALAALRDYEESGLGWFWTTDAQGTLRYISASAARVLGAEPRDLVGKPISSLFHAEQESAGQSGRTLPLALASHKSFSDLSLRARIDDQEVWWSISGRPQTDPDGAFLGFRGNGIDVTAQLREQRDTSRLARFDSLTGLCNRFTMTQRLETTLNAFKSSQRPCALLMIDLDRFKQVNDTLGHPVGDALLKQVAERLRGVIGKDGEIGRLGGDEFEIIIPDCDDRGKLGDIAKKVIALVSQPYSIDRSRCVIGASIGIAIAPFDGSTAEELVSNADLALYAAKGGGRGQFRFFSIELQNNAEKRKVLKEDLREALSQGQIRLAFQPVVSAKSNTVTGFEALMRWEHPEFGELPPSVLVPIAEESDLIVSLGEWAIRESCMAAAHWPGSLPVAVNIAPAHFAHRGFIAGLTQALAESELSPERLELEFGEAIFGLGDELIQEGFSELRHLGVKVTLDNFGAGASPLGHLRNHRFDKVKIDPNVVQEMTEPRSRSAAIAAAIATLTDKLGMAAVAVGIETRGELKTIQDLGIDLIQGYIYSPPCSDEEVGEALTTGQWVIKPDDPNRQQGDRRSVYRRVGVIHEDFRYDVIMRNLSRSGASIEGLADVPVGTQFVVDLGEGQLIVATVRRSEGSLQGLEFETSLVDDGAGGLCTRHRVPRHLLEAMGMPTNGNSGGGVIALNTTGGINLPRFASADLSRQHGKAA